MAQRPAANTAAPPKVLSPPVVLGSHMVHEHMELDGAVRPPAIRTTNHRGIGTSDGFALDKGNDFTKALSCERPRSAPVNMSLESIDIVTSGRSSVSRDSVMIELECPEQLSLGSIDITSQNIDFALLNESAWDGNGPRDMEAKMRRLKLELKQTMDMYSTACKEAISAKKKAKELHDWKMEEARRFREARHAEDSALAIVEREKAKCKAAIEAAQRLAEMEAQRRKPERRLKRRIEH